jgi:hypothetical protein
MFTICQLMLLFFRFIGFFGGDITNSTEKKRGIYTVGWNNRRKRPNTVGKRPTVGIILRPSPKKLR